MIYNVTEGQRRKVPLTTAQRIKKMKEVNRKLWVSKYAPEQDDIKLEDIPF